VNYLRQFCQWHWKHHQLLVHLWEDQQCLFSLPLHTASQMTATLLTYLLVTAETFYFLYYLHYRYFCCNIIIISSMPQDGAQLCPRVHSNQCYPALDAKLPEGRCWQAIDWFQWFGPMSVMVFLWVYSPVQPAGGPLIAARRAHRWSISGLVLAIWPNCL